MAFNVGAGVLQKMTELNDKPARDSTFVNSIDTKSRSEFGYGIKYDYRAIGTLNNNTWSWEVIAYKLNMDTVSTQFSDMRGKLPKRNSSISYQTRPTNVIDTLCIHYTAAPPDRTVQQIAQYQITVQSGDLFPEIAYHLFVEQNGLLVWCHDANKRVWGSAQSGMNERAIHICYSGDVEPNQQQIDGLSRGRTFAQHSMLQPSRQLIVQGHKDGYATQCPGPKWPTWKALIS